MQTLPFLAPAAAALGLRAALLSTLALSTAPMPAHAIEEPDYEVVRAVAGIEVRQYRAYTVAEVVVPGPASDAGGQAFPILAGYIFGRNKGERKFEMTAPVTQSIVPATLEMTAPVTRSAVAGGFRVQFVLPKGVTAASAPEPEDPRVQLRDVAPVRVAVIRYSGRWTAANDDEHLARLEAALRDAGVAWTGEAVYARYNAPFTPWFMRRNEIWLHVSPAG